MTPASFPASRRHPGPAGMSRCGHHAAHAHQQFFRWEHQHGVASAAWLLEAVTVLNTKVRANVVVREPLLNR